VLSDPRGVSVHCEIHERSDTSDELKQMEAVTQSSFLASQVLISPLLSDVVEIDGSEMR
jgi:hypothetical protein